MDVMAEDQLIREQPAVDKPAKLRPLLALRLHLRRLQIVALVHQVELVHERLLHDCLLVGIVESRRSIDHDAQKSGGMRLGRRPVQERLKPLARVVNG